MFMIRHLQIKNGLCSQQVWSTLQFFKDGLDIKATLRNISQSKSNTIRALISLSVSNASKNLHLYCEQAFPSDLHGNRTTRSVALNEEKVTWRVQNTERQHNNDYRYNSQYLTLMNERNKRGTCVLLMCVVTHPHDH